MTETGQPSPQPSSGGRFSKFRKAVRRAKKNIFVSFAIDIFVIVGSALVLSLLIKTFLLRSFFIPSGSMLETLQINDRIIVNELVPDVVPIGRGDVVVFSDPGDWLNEAPAGPSDPISAIGDWFLSSFGVTAADSSQHLVKRVIGVAGDHIVCCDVDGKLTINGVAITEPYLPDGTVPSTMHFDVVVPKDSIWVMGDNRSNSEDSRFHQTLPSKGFVNKKFIVGRAFLVSWPFSHWKWLDNYPDVFKNVPKP